MNLGRLMFQFQDWQVAMVVGGGFAAGLALRKEQGRDSMTTC
jgi:hypothetical protein